MVLKISPSDNGRHEGETFLSTSDGKPSLYGSGSVPGLPFNANMANSNYNLNNALTPRTSASLYSRDAVYLDNPPSTTFEVFGFCVATGHGLIATVGDDYNIHVYDAEVATESQGLNVSQAYKFTINNPASGQTASSLRFGDGWNNITIAEGKIFIGAPGYGSNSYGRIYVYDLEGVLLYEISCPGVILVQNAYFGRTPIAVSNGKLYAGHESGGASTRYVFEFDANTGALTRTIQVPAGLTTDSFGSGFGKYSIAAADGMLAIGTAFRLPGTNSGNFRAGVVNVYHTDSNNTNPIELINPELNITPGNNAEGFGKLNIAIGEGVIAVGSEEASALYGVESYGSDSANAGKVYLYDYNGTHIKTLTHFNQNAAVSGSFNKPGLFISGGRIYATCEQLYFGNAFTRFGGIAVWDLQGNPVGYYRPLNASTNFGRAMSTKDGYTVVLQADFSNPKIAVWKNQKVLTPAGIAARARGY